jgi:hypothetical protein
MSESPTKEEITEVVNLKLIASRARMQSATAKMYDEQITMKQWFVECAEAIREAVRVDHAIKNRCWQYEGDKFLRPVLTPGDEKQIAARHAAECDRLEVLYKQIFYNKKFNQIEAEKALRKFWKKWG